MTYRRSRLGRIVAAALIRGGEAPFILRDLDDAFAHDVARGLTPAEARRRDRRNVLTTVASLAADALRPSAWRPSLVDVRLGFRAIARTPGLSLVAVMALAIGIPVGLAPMHAVDAIERPLPGDPDGRIRTLGYRRGTRREPATLGDYVLWRDSLRSFDRIAAYRPTTVTLDAPGEGPPVPGIETTASTFEILRTPAMLGRVLVAADERPEAPAVVVIGADLWRTRFAGDRAVVGRAVSVSGTPSTIVGVMPTGFRFPTSQQVWMPLRLANDGGGPRSGPRLVTFGRLAGGVQAEAAEAEVQSLAHASAARDPEAFERLDAAVLPAWHLTFDFPTAGGLRALPEFLLVQVLMLAPLAVACVNVGLLILAQTSTRASEFAVRTALGAGRGRIITQVFVEFLVLSVLAAGAGVFLLDWLSGRLLTALGITLPYWIDAGATVSTTLRALGLAAGSAVAAALVPAIRLTGRSIDTNIRKARSGRFGHRLGGLPAVLIAADVAVAVVAIGVALGLWAKVQASMPRQAVDGIPAGEVLSVTLHLPSASRDEVARAQAALVERLRAEPGVRAVTFATALPRMDHPTRQMEVEPDAAAGPAAAPAGPFRVRTARVAAGYFDELAQPLVAGRGFDARDLAPDAGTVVVNTTFARRVFGGANPVGRRVRSARLDGAPGGPWLEIIGVVGHLGAHALTPSEDDAVYEPLATGEANPLRLAIWTRGDAHRLAPRVQAVATAARAEAVVSAPVPLDRVFEGDWYLLRAFVVGAVLLVGVLLSLAVSALYAILSLVVSRRTREIGIRVALGASRRDIARDVAMQALAPIAVGVLLGLPAAAGLCYEFLALTDAESTVPAALAMASMLGAVVLLVVSLAACTVPTLRALRIAPVDALRREG